MTFTDSPDWQEVAVAVSGGAMPDAPDWQRTMTGPGGGGVAGAGGSGFSFYPPSVLGWKWWTVDPGVYMTTWASYGNQVRLGSIYVPETITVSNLVYPMTGAGVGSYLGPAQCGIYAQAGAGLNVSPAITLLGSSALAATLTAFNNPSGGTYKFSTVPLTAPLTLQANTLYYVATMLNSQNNACFYGPANNTAWPIIGPTGYYIVPTQTSLPASEPASNVGLNGQIVWTAVS